MRIALALGSGGARGYTHIGVIDELHARGHHVVAISGCSMGAVVGGLEAAGKLGLFTEWVTSLSQRDLLMLLDPAFKGPGALYGQRIMDRVADMLGGALIEDLPIHFTAVATDLTQQREVWFQRGSVATALRASIGIPSVFTPVMIAGRLLVDGAVLNPMPMEPLLGAPADLTVGVNLSGKRESTPSSPEPAVAASGGGLAPLGRLRNVLDLQLLRGLREWLAHRGEEPAILRVLDDAASVAPPTGEVLTAPVGATGGPSTATRVAVIPGTDALASVGGPDFDQLPRGLRTADVVSRSLETASAMISRFRMAASPPDLLVQFPQDMATMFDFHRAAELIARGRERAASVFDEAGL